MRLAGGDARRSLTYLESAAGAAKSKGLATIDLATAETAVDRAAVRYDRQGDQHYDVISAFIKSVRGSDADAALHYLARMIEAGEDPRFIARRLVILASEDVGLADPTALTTAVAAAQAVQLIGMPEARLNLAQATIALAVAPKSNAVIMAIEAAIADVRAGKIGTVPPHLRDAHYAGAKKLAHGARYTYSHDEPFGIAEQQYAPDVVLDARVLPADRARGRGPGQAAVGADPPDHPRRRGIGSVPMTVAILLLACLVLAGAVVALRWLCAELRDRVRRAGGAACRDGRRARRLTGARGAAAFLEPARGVPAPSSTSGDEEFVITRLGSRARRASRCRPLEPRLFADLVLRESVVKAASFAHGVRRGLSPANRNRIWFEMRREVKRARKERKAEEREAIREWRARQRAAVQGGRRRMKRGLWFAAGAGAGVYAMARARRLAEAFTVDGLRDRWEAVGLGARMLREDVAQGQAEKETELRERYGLPPHGVPQLPARARCRDGVDDLPDQRIEEGTD